MIASHLVSSSLSCNTKLTYHTALQSFTGFCQAMGITQPWPVPSWILSLFVAWIYKKGLSANTVKTYISGISYAHKINHLTDPTESFYFKSIMRGFKRGKSLADTRVPITIETLQSLIRALGKVCVSWYELCLFKAAFLIAFFGLFRISELVFTSAALMHYPLKAKDVTFLTKNGKHTMNLVLRYSKNNQSGRSQGISVAEISNSDLCPVSAARRLLTMHPAGDFLFCHSNSKPVTRYQFSAVLKRCMIHIGLPTCRILTHSFRIGAASYLEAQGVPHNIIMRKGRWSSDAYLTYLR